MKKIFFTIFLLFAIFGVSFSQNRQRISESDREVLEQRMIEKSKEIKTLQCVFVQEKTSKLVVEKAVAKGILLYQSPDAMRWEYTAPTPSTLILNGNNAVMLNKEGKKVGNAKMLKQLIYLIINAINGENIKNDKQFSREIYETDNAQILVVLTPVQKRLKEFYTSIELKIDSKTLLANEIVLNEKSGDNIVIFLINKELNKEISPTNFSF